MDSPPHGDEGLPQSNSTAGEKIGCFMVCLHELNKKRTKHEKRKKNCLKSWELEHQWVKTACLFPFKDFVMLSGFGLEIT